MVLDARRLPFLHQNSRISGIRGEGRYPGLQPGLGNRLGLRPEFPPKQSELLRLSRLSSEVLCKHKVSAIPLSSYFDKALMCPTPFLFGSQSGSGR